MAETKVRATEIQKLSVKGKIVDVPVEGGDKGETERVLVTQVTFEYEGAPGQFDGVLRAMVNGHIVDAVFASPQSQFDSVTSRVMARKSRSGNRANERATAGTVAGGEKQMLPRSIPQSNKVSIKVKCPSDYGDCSTCYLFNGRTCTFGAFSHGLQPRADFGTSGIEIEQAVLDVRELRKTALDELNAMTRRVR